MYEEYKLRKFVNSNVKKKLIYVVRILAIMAIALTMFIMMLCSCKAKERVITNTEYKTEYRDRLQRDSIYVQDSIMIREKGDSVWIREVKYKYVDRFLRDTVNVTDTVKVNITDTKYVTTNKIYWYQKFPMYIGWIAILLCAVWIGIKIKKLWL